MEDHGPAGSNGPGALAGMMMPSSKCFLCEREIAVLEPFLTALAFAGTPRQLVHAPFHLLCHAEVIADHVVDAIDNDDDDSDDDSDDDLAAAIGAQLGKILSPMLQPKRPARRTRR